jgi:hypothetical protein
MSISKIPLQVLTEKLTTNIINCRDGYCLLNKISFYNNYQYQVIFMSSKCMNYNLKINCANSQIKI